MNYHKSLKQLSDQIAILTFTTVHLFDKDSKMDEFEFDVTRITECNGKSFSTFKNDIGNIITTIEENEKNLLLNIGSHHKKELLEKIISLDHLRYDYFGGSYKGLVLEVAEPKLSENKMYKAGMIDYKNTIDSRNSKEEFYKVIFDAIGDLKDNLTMLLLDENEEIVSVGKKLKWNAKPSVVSYLMLQLAEAGWLDPELKNNFAHREELAQVISEVFSFNGSDSTSKKTIRNYFTPQQVTILQKSKPEIIKLTIPNVKTLG